MEEKKKQRAFNILGNIAVINFPKSYKSSVKKKFALDLLKKQSNIKTVLEKSGKFKGRLRKMETKYLAGEKTKEVLYKENNCLFRFNIDTSYFSPRLSNERKEIADIIKKDETVLVLFAGVAPFSIVIAKNSKAKKVISVELNKEASKYAIQNVELNKIKNKVEIIQADVKKLQNKLPPQRFDVIVMARPQLKDTFIKESLKYAKKGTRIYYYDFCKEDEINSIVKKVKSECSLSKKKIEILKTKSAGEIAPYKVRCRVDFEIV